MGCAASKEANSAVDPHMSKPPHERPLATTTTTGSTSSSKTPNKQTGGPISIRVNNRSPSPSSVSKGGYNSASSTEFKIERKLEDGSSLISMDGWKVRPGYSSGASSVGSDMDELGDLPSANDDTFLPAASKHSDILALSSLREQMAADGDFAKIVVRIETPFDTPIEEIYTGVHDGAVLGSGVSGIVRLVVHKATGVKYAVKCLDLGLIDTTEGLMQLRDEIFIMCQLDHPNIVRIEEVYESPNEIYIVQELCLGGDLFDRLDDQPDYHYTEAHCAKLVKQMLSSIRYLHSKGIIHRDLKLENFLFSSSSPNSELRMIDFGLSKHFEVGQNHCEKVGTPYTVAPEIIRGSYDEKCDVWALGVITYLLLSGETPFGGLDGESLLLVKENIMRAEVVFEPQDVWASVSEEGKAFVKALLNPDPKERPTAKETQRCSWIQVWAKKDVKEGGKLTSKTVNSLMKFKESSDMQKLLSEVLSFTLLPEQIVELRTDFEKLDTDGDGEISLMALKQVLMENAEAGALGALTEQEVEDIFDAIRVRKSEPTIRWHEFLAAGLSQARVDDRNLRLAFERLDAQRKGFITFEDLSDVLGNSTESEDLEKMWLESLEDCNARLDRITFDDFKKIMKGQPKDRRAQSPEGSGKLCAVPEGQKIEKILSTMSTVPSGMELAELEAMLGTTIENPRAYFQKRRSTSYEHGKSTWENELDASDSSVPLEKLITTSDRTFDKTSITSIDEGSLVKDASLALLLPTNAEEEFGEITSDTTMSPLVTNRALYRKHRELRLSILEASKQFDKKRNEIEAAKQAYPSHHHRASLIMRRGVKPPVEVEDAHSRALFEAAAKRCGRRVGGRHGRRKKTASDVTGMLLKAKA